MRTQENNEITESNNAGDKIKFLFNEINYEKNESVESDMSRGYIESNVDPWFFFIVTKLYLHNCTRYEFWLFLRVGMASDEIVFDTFPKPCFGQ